MRKIQFKMTKKQISKMKSIAKKRKNRRLSNGEAARIMAQVMGAGTNRNVQVHDDYKCGEGNVGEFATYSPDFQIILDNKYPVSKTNKTNKINKSKKTSRPFPLLPKNGKKLTGNQFKSLMKKVQVELGINDNSYEVIDLNSKVEQEEGMTDILLAELILIKGEETCKKCLKDLAKNKKITNETRYQIIGYHMGLLKKIPLVLIPKNIRSNKVIRSFKYKYHQNTHKVTSAKYFDDNLILAMQGKQRKWDNFDKLNVNTQIQWARDAYDMLGDLYIPVQDIFNDRKQYGEVESKIIMDVMKEACKINKIKPFSGNFATPCWVCHRIGILKNRPKIEELERISKLKNKAIDIILKSSYDKTIPVLNDKQAIRKVIPTLKKLNLYKDFKSNEGDTKYLNRKLKLAAEIINNKII